VAGYPGEPLASASAARISGATGSTGVPTGQVDDAVGDGPLAWAVTSAQRVPKGRRG